MEKLSDIGEDGLIERLTKDLTTGPDLVSGVGDDCAVLKTTDPEVWQLFKVDSVVEGVHFLPETEAEKAGWKAMCRPLSDHAAMGGGEPKAALVNLAAPADYPVNRLEGLYCGMESAAREFGVTIAGGESVSLPGENAALAVSVSLTGSIDRSHCVFRSGARVGNAILVTGVLGGSLGSEHHLSFYPRIREADSIAGSGGWKPTAMMDISDGLAKDLPRLAKASGVGYRIDFEKVPSREGCDLSSALTDGEDYELLFTMVPAFTDHFLKEWSGIFPSTPLTIIGEITETVETPLEGGWDHFAKS